MMSRFTLRRVSPLLALATAAAFTLALAPAQAQSGDAPSEETTAVATAAAPAALLQIARSDTLTTGTWDMAVGDVFAAISPIRRGYTEVRIGLNMTNIGDTDAGYRIDGFFTDPTYPRLSLIDANGTKYRLLPVHSTRGLLPGSTLSTVPSGMTARWTVGFQVPTAYASDLELAVAGTEGSVAFDLSSAAGGATTEQPANMLAVSIGDEIPWGDALSVSAFDHGSLVCGDPNTQLAAQIVAVGFEVGNRTLSDADWPGVRFPENLAIAQWADGGSARMAFETFAGDFDPLLKWAEDAVRIPAGGDGVSASDTYKRAMLFAVPRDARLGDNTVDDAPIGIWLQPEGTDAVWLELDGAGTLAISPTLCDEGNFSFAIPHSFSPGTDFVVGLSDPAPDPTAQDFAATQLLNEALVVAGNFRASHGDSYAGMTAGGLAELWNGVTYDNGFVGSVGTVGVTTDVLESGEVLGILVTESASGTFFCLADAGGTVISQFAGSLAELEELCGPTPDPVEEAPAEEG
ncbi:MAG: hypothetical protein V3R84_03120 [Acidimicrobiia bacterium]